MLEPTIDSEARRMADEMQQYLPLFIPDISISLRFTHDTEEVETLPLRDLDSQESRECRWADISTSKTIGVGLNSILRQLFRNALKWRYQTYMHSAYEVQFLFPGFTEPYQSGAHLTAATQRGTERELQHGHVLLGFWPVIRGKSRVANAPTGSFLWKANGVAMVMPSTTKDIPLASEWVGNLINRRAC